MAKNLYVFTGILLFSSAITLAHNPIKKRQFKQQTRITNGIKSGELTRAETIQLQKQQIHINQTKKAAQADGVLTKKERIQIQHKQNKANVNIYHKKHNAVSR